LLAGIRIIDSRFLLQSLTYKLFLYDKPPQMPPSDRFNPFCYLEVGEFFQKVIDAKAIIDAPMKLLFVSYDDILAAKKKERRVDFKKVVKIITHLKIIQTGALPYTPMEIVRPPAVYSNTSPYGIASALHFGEAI
jgi:hypothetical protein